jgi:hypothetical protein
VDVEIKRDSGIRKFSRQVNGFIAVHRSDRIRLDKGRGIGKKPSP